MSSQLYGTKSDELKMRPQKQLCTWQAAAGQQGPKSDTAGAGGFGPPRPPVKIKQIGQGDVPGTGQQQLALTGAGEEAGEDDEEDEGEEEEDPYQLPITHEVVLGSSHIKAVTCMDVDHTGNRLVTGSMDMNMRLYDFNGMKRDMKAFRELEAQEGHPVLALSWSPTGELLLAVTGSAKAKIFDRDGHTKGEFVRGDMYIRDPRNTKGHVSALTCGQWHPQDRYTAMTSSEDGTIRIWDTHNIMQKTVVKPTTSKPVRTAVTTCGYGLDGKLIAAGLVDGSIQLWNVSGKFGTSAAVGQVMPPAPQMVEKQGWTYVSKSGQVVRGAHLAGTEITSLAFSQDGHTLLSRSLDSSLKVWDLRKFSQPVKVWGDLPCSYASTKVIFSPDEQLAVTGVSAAGEEGGALVFLDTKRHTLVRKVGVPGTATALAWHHRLNQIFVGIGNRKMGSTRVLYDTTYSERGVLIGAARAVRKPSPFDFQPQELVREARVSGKRKRQQEVEAAIKSHKPDPGMAAGMGKQGRIGTTGGTLLTQHLLKQKGKLKPPDLTMDPREAILRHAGKKDVFSQFTAAYKETQPEAIYAVSEDEEEKEDD
ncbi:WD40 repeat-like protein [Haematococcus lacustris]